jgi:hypothetical protein
MDQNPYESPQAPERPQPREHRQTLLGIYSLLLLAGVAFQLVSAWRIGNDAAAALLLAGASFGICALIYIYRTIRPRAEKKSTSDPPPLNDS